MNQSSEVASQFPISNVSVSNGNISTGLLHATYNKNYDHVMKSTIFVVCGLLIIVINTPSLIVLVLAKVRPPNIQIVHMLSLGISDFIVGISWCFLVSEYLYETVSISHSACFIRLTILTVAYFNSSNQVLIICLNRLHMIIKLRPMITNRNTLLVAIVSTFVLSASLIIVPFAINHDIPNVGYMNECIFITLFENNYANKVRIYYTSLYSLSELGILLSYSCIVTKLCAHRYRMRKIRPDVINMATGRGSLRTITHSTVRQNQFKEKKSIIILGVVVILYALCVTPMHVCLMMAGAGLEVPLKTINSLTGIGLLNSALNPLVYLFIMPEIKKMICGRSRQIRI